MLMNTSFSHRIAALILLLVGLTGSASAERNFIIVQSTTSTQNSGLFDYILPRFHEDHEFDVRVVAEACAITSIMGVFQPDECIVCWHDLCWCFERRVFYTIYRMCLILFPFVDGLFV